MKQNSWVAVSRHDKAVPTTIICAQSCTLFFSIALSINVFVNNLPSNIMIFFFGGFGVILSLYIYSINNFSKTVFVKLTKDTDIIINIVCLTVLLLLEFSNIFKSLSFMVATITIMFQDVFELKNHKMVILSLIFFAVIMIARILVLIYQNNHEFDIILFQFNETNSLKLGSMKIAIFFMLFFVHIQTLMNAINDPSEKKLLFLFGVVHKPKVSIEETFAIRKKMYSYGTIILAFILLLMFVISGFIEPDPISSTQFLWYKVLFYLFAFALLIFLILLFNKNINTQNMKRNFKEPYVWIVGLLQIMYTTVDIMQAILSHGNLSIVKWFLFVLLTASLIAIDSLTYRYRGLQLGAFVIYIINCINLITKWTFRDASTRFIFGENGNMSDQELKRSIMMNMLSVMIPAFKRALFDKDNKCLAFSVSPIFRLTGTTDVEWFDQNYYMRKRKSTASRDVRLTMEAAEERTLSQRNRESILVKSLSIFFEDKLDEVEKAKHSTKSDKKKNRKQKGKKSNNKKEIGERGSIFVNVKTFHNDGSNEVSMTEKEMVRVEISQEADIIEQHEEDNAINTDAKEDEAKKQLDDYLDLWS